MRTWWWLVLAGLLVAAGACRGDAPDDDARAAEEAPALLPVARTEVAGASWGGGIAVVGGLTEDGAASARADLYRTASNRWQRLAALPVALHHTAAVAAADRLFVIGGYTVEGAQWRESDRVFSLGDREPAWREETPLPAPRGAHAAAALRDRIVVVGGVSAGDVAASSVVFEPGVGWRSGPTMLRAREHLAATVAGGRVYVIAGREGSVNFTDVESWDGRAGAFRSEPSLNDSRGGIGASTVNGRPCVTGGEEAAGTIGSVECLNGERWRRVGRLRTARHGLAVVALGGRLHVIGGGAQPGLFVTQAHEVLDL